MTILTVALKYLRGRLVASTLTAVSIALGVSLVVASVLLAGGIKAGFIAGATDYNLVVGAKGSPTQLVLSVVFRMDLATPNIERPHLVERWLPCSGDLADGHSSPDCCYQLCLRSFHDNLVFHGQGPFARERQSTASADRHGNFAPARNPEAAFGRAPA
jgi:hypothetical protein